MAKAKNLYVCRECGAKHSQWSGQCSDCKAWNSLEETVIAGTTAAPAAAARQVGYAGESNVESLAAASEQADQRFSTGLGELDRVLGGGLVAGAVVLIGGDPGIGKSTLLLQATASLSATTPTLYVSGEESLRQIALRAIRLGANVDELKVLAETCVERIIELAQQHKPKVIVADSIQTMFTETLQSAPGAVAQLREATARLVRYAKQTGTSVFLVGHVTKDGSIAGPRVLEHMVDTVLYFESDAGSRYRMLRAVKNRFGAANELGVFAMDDDGLREVKNPSAIFLSRHDEAVPGSVVMVTREGTRPLLVEVQALVDESHSHNPKRVALGLDQNRLALLLAVLHRHAGISMFDQDFFANVVGGVKVSETAADLPLLLAGLSSFRGKALPHDWVAFGEIGLAGEIRPVPFGEERLVEAAKQGFTTAIVPQGNKPKSSQPRKALSNLTIKPVNRVDQLIELLLDQ